MSNLFDWLLPQNFLPHGHCYLWRPDVLWLHVGSDTVIAASYYAIPVALGYFVHRRRAVLPYWWVPVLFAMFIFLCGTTHVLNIWTVWRPDYVVDGMVKLATALASASTAVLVFASLPQAIALRTPIELQAEVEARTTELRTANERLRQEGAARQEAIRHRDEFLAMLAHELRNPLAPISNASELLGRYMGPSPEARATLAILQRQVRHLTRLVDDLLDVERISRGQINIRKETIDVRTVLDQAVETVQSGVQAKFQRLNVHKPSSPVFVSGDLARLVQCLGNIVHNAAKYTESHGEIDVNVEESPAELKITVRDSGIGIAPDVLPTIFDLFVQGHRTMDRADGGLGIGLTVVKKIIQLHGGSVSADSAGLGRGTTVTIHLPTVRDATAPDREQASFTTPRRRILVVDDNEDAADSLAMMLRLDGHEVSTAFDAPGALSAVEKLRPEVVLLDLGLPQMDGYEVAGRLRAQLGSACPCLIASTGYGQPEDRARSLAAGFNAHLTKPIDLEELRQVLVAIPVIGSA